MPDAVDLAEERRKRDEHADRLLSREPAKSVAGKWRKRARKWTDAVVRVIGRLLG